MTCHGHVAMPGRYLSGELNEQIPSVYSVVVFRLIFNSKIGHWILQFFLRTQRVSSGPTHIGTEGRAPLWGSEFTTKAATPHGDSKELLPSHCVVGISLAWLRWCAYGAPARLADSTSWISCFATTRWSVVTLDPGKRQMSILLLVDTTIEGASPSHARQE